MNHLVNEVRLELLSILSGKDASADCDDPIICNFLNDKMPYESILKNYNIQKSNDPDLWEKMQFGTFIPSKDREGSFSTGKAHPNLIKYIREYKEYQPAIFLFKKHRLFVYYHELAHAVNYFYCTNPITFQNNYHKTETVADLVALALMKVDEYKPQYMGVIQHLKNVVTEHSWDKDNKKYIIDTENILIEKIRNLLNDEQIYISSQNIFDFIRTHN